MMDHKPDTKSNSLWGIPNIQHEIVKSFFLISYGVPWELEPCGIKSALQADVFSRTDWLWAEFSVDITTVIKSLNSTVPLSHRLIGSEFKLLDAYGADRNVWITHAQNSPVVLSGGIMMVLMLDFSPSE